MPAGNQERAQLHRARSIRSVSTQRIIQIHDFEVTAIFWTGGKRLKAIKHPGHAALLLRRAKVEDAKLICRDWRKAQYVSWIPASSDVDSNGVRVGQFSHNYWQDVEYEISDSTNEALQKRDFYPRAKQAVVAIERPDDDWSESLYIEKYGTLADKFITLRAFNPGNVKNIGLFMNNIPKWTRHFWSGHDSYYALASKTNNCASVVWRALTVSGANAFCEYHSNTPNPKLYVTPQDLEEFCERIAKGIELANIHLELVINEVFSKLDYNSGLTEKAPTGFQNSKELYSYNDWRRESEVRYKVRGKILRNIDISLQEYHKYDWPNNIADWDDRILTFNDKFLALLNILRGLKEHLFASTSGKRDAAIVALAIQVANVFARLREASGMTWQEMDYRNIASNGTGDPGLIEKIVQRQII